LIKEEEIHLHFSDFKGIKPKEDRVKFYKDTEFTLFSIYLPKKLNEKLFLFEKTLVKTAKELIKSDLHSTEF
jgi:hypothetical protein